MFFTEDEVLMRWRHWSKNQWEIFNESVMPLLSCFALNLLTN